MQRQRQDTDPQVTVSADWKWYAGLFVGITALCGIWGSLLWVALK